MRTTRTTKSKKARPIQLLRLSSTSYTVCALIYSTPTSWWRKSLSYVLHHFCLNTGRLASLVGRSSGYIENLPAVVKRRVEGLKGVQEKQTNLENQMKREMFELEKKVLRLIVSPHIPSNLSPCIGSNHIVPRTRCSTL
jgi:hypothetical protein